MFGPGGLKPQSSPAVRKEVRRQPAAGQLNSNRVATTSTRPLAKGPPSNRYQLSPSTALRTKSQSLTSPASLSNTARHASISAVRKPQKRPSASPAFSWGSSDEGESDDDESDRPRKKQRAAAVGELAHDLMRRVRDETLWSTDGDNAARLDGLIHSRDVTAGAHAKDFRPAFAVLPAVEVKLVEADDTPTGDGTVVENHQESEHLGEDEAPTIHLQYPSPSNEAQEVYALVRTREVDAYDPPLDLRDTMATTLTYYLPSKISAPLLDESSGILRRLRRALEDNDLERYRAAVSDYNSILRRALEDGEVSRRLDTLASPLPLPLVDRILTQVYSRVVSPRINELRAYAAGSDNVYGELQYAFCSQVFKDSGLKSGMTFLDLGSGVGNVVLQAALEVGAHAVGAEVMPAAAELATQQKLEFQARSTLWGLCTGSITLLKGDFFTLTDLHQHLLRADVVLVNNQAFQPETNAKLLSNLLLDLKEGARLVSLKSFAPDFKLTSRTMGSPFAVFAETKKRFYHNWVSWTHAGGDYHVAVKDSTRIERILGSKQ